MARLKKKEYGVPLSRKERNQIHNSPQGILAKFIGFLNGRIGEAIKDGDKNSASARTISKIMANARLKGQNRKN